MASRLLDHCVPVDVGQQTETKPDEVDGEEEQEEEDDGEEDVGEDEEEDGEGEEEDDEGVFGDNDFCKEKCDS